MGEFLKCIDPTKRWVWDHPEMPGVRFEYRALAGPTFTRDLGARYLNSCVTRAWNVSVGDVDYKEWSIETGPPVEWARVLPADVANALFLAIATVSLLTGDERRDSRSPSGAPSGATSTNAPDAGATAGSAPDGMMTEAKAGGASPTVTPPRGRKKTPTGRRC